MVGELADRRLFLVALNVLLIIIVLSSKTISAENMAQALSLSVLTAITAWYAYKTSLMARAATEQAVATQQLSGRTYFAELIALVIDPLNQRVERANDNIMHRTFEWISFERNDVPDILEEENLYLFEITAAEGPLYNIPSPLVLGILSNPHGAPLPLLGQLGRIERRRPVLIKALHKHEEDIARLNTILIKLAIRVPKSVKTNLPPTLPLGGYEGHEFTDEYSVRDGKSLLVIAQSIEDEARNKLITFFQIGKTKCLPIRASTSVAAWRADLEQKASLLGSRILATDELRDITLDQLGRATSVVSRENTTIVQGDDSSIGNRQIETEAERRLRHFISSGIFQRLIGDRKEWRGPMMDEGVAIAVNMCGHLTTQIGEDREAASLLSEVSKLCESVMTNLVMISSELSNLREEIKNEYQLDEATISQLRKR